MRLPFKILLLLLALLVQGISEPQFGKIITITAGTAIRVVTTRTMANSILIQPLHGASAGLVYVLNAQPSVPCANAGAGTTFVAELGPATSTAAGSSYTFPSNGDATNASGGFDVQYYCIDGAHSGDTVAVSWDLRN